MKARHTNMEEMLKLIGAAMVAVMLTVSLRTLAPESSALLGAAAGVLSKKIDDRRIRKLVLLLLVVSGAMLIAQNL